MRRLVALLTMAVAAHAADATIFSYDSGPVSGSGFETEVLFSFATDVTAGPVTSSSGSFTVTALKLFFDGKQNGSGTFDPRGYGGNVNNGVLSLSFTAPSYVSYTSPFGGPPYSGKGAPVSFSGQIAAPAVPEPASWLMMVGGFGLVGWTVRRRRPRLTPPGQPPRAASCACDVAGRGRGRLGAVPVPAPAMGPIKFRVAE